MKIFSIFLVLSLLNSCHSENNKRYPASESNVELRLPGEIIISLLKPENFREKYGPVWVLMDGGSDLKDILEKYPDVTLADIGMDSIPDARGKFLRMHNGDKTCQPNGPCEFNPDNTPLGGAQADALKFHDVTHPSIASRFNAGGNNYVATWWDYNNGVNGPPHRTYGEAYESRPKNITVNYFVKIASCPKNYDGPCL